MCHICVRVLDILEAGRASVSGYVLAESTNLLSLTRGNPPRSALEGMPRLLVGRASERMGYMRALSTGKEGSYFRLKQLALICDRTVIALRGIVFDWP
jgi:hypothetical protein